MMNRPSVKAAIQSMATKTAPPTVRTEEMQVLQVNITRTDALLDEGGLIEDKIRTDRSLSDSGQKEKLKAHADQSVSKFSALGRVVADSQAAHSRLTTVLIGDITAIPQGVNEIVDYLRSQEIRAGIGKAGAALAFLKALEADQLEVARALLAVPGGSWVPADIRARGEEDYAQRVNLPVWETRRSVEYLRDQLLALSNLIALWLLGLGAAPDTVNKTLHRN